MSTKFKPTHRLNTGELVELELKFINRMYRAECGLFHFDGGHCGTFQMDHVTELPKVIQVAAHEEPEPLRVAPAVGTEYWRIDVTSKNRVRMCEWRNSVTGRQVLAAGDAYATKEDALAADAARQKARGFTS